MADITLTVPDELMGIQTKPQEPAPQPMQQAPAGEPEFEVIDVGGAEIEIQKGASPDAIKKAIQDYMGSADFYERIDRKRGAPARVRKMVGDAKTPDERLATIRKVYQDAQPYGDDNFVFTDPESGRPTLYNPKGLDYGDVASVARETMIGVGSSLGAAFGGAGGFVAGIPTGPGALLSGTGGAMAGAGLGAATAATVYDYLAEKFGGTVYEGGIGRRTGELLTEAGGAMLGQGIGDVTLPALASAAKTTLGGGTAKAQSIYNTLSQYGITPTAGAVTGGKGAGRIESALDQAAASATTMRNQIEEVIGQSQAAVENLASQIGKAKSQQGAGVALQEASKDALKRFAVEQSEIEERLAAKIGEDKLFNIDALRSFMGDMLAFKGEMPGFSKQAYGDILDKLTMITEDAKQYGGAIPYSAFRQIRTFFGQKMSDMTEGVNRSLYKRMYRAMTEDLEAGAQVAGVADEFKSAMNFTKSFKDEYDDLLTKMVDYDAPEKGYRFLMNSRRDGGTYFNKLKEQFTRDEWNDISATVIQKMGHKNFGNEADDAFSVSTFLTNWNSIADEAKDALFDGVKGGVDIRKSLDELVGAFSEMSKSARLRNFSNTAGAAHTLGIMSSLGSDVSKMLLGAAAIGGYTPGLAAAGVAGTVVGGIVAPKVASKLITNPAFVKWLAEGPAVRNGAEAGAHIGRLGAIYAANPEIRDQLSAFMDTLRSPDTMGVNEGASK
jgi:hypothetical protein